MPCKKSAKCACSMAAKKPAKAAVTAQLPTQNVKLIAWVNEIVTAWAKGEGDGAQPTPGVERELLDLHDALCGDGFTDEVNDVPLYDDTVHFSPAGAATVWTWLVRGVLMRPSSGGEAPDSRSEAAGWKRRRPA